eukprot:GHRQ01011546.1.p1 GENE.GHRQ01011546.1~~GHRQ01011546.1.p1  ORF type:complete len:372 (+),score=124.71 GHRQ01011546.1:600-1715(+)
MQPPYNYGPPPPQGVPPYNYGAPMGPPSQGRQQQGQPGLGQPSSHPGYSQQSYQQMPGQQHAQMPHVNSFPGPMVSSAYSPQQPGFVPSQSAQYSGQQQYVPQSYAPQAPPSTGVPQMPAAPSMAGAGFMSNLNPLSLMTGGGLLAAPQHYMQERVSWIKTNMTGGTMSALFNISNNYVANKLLMLLLPLLSRWTYGRMHEQIAGGQRYRPPSVDVNAPDLFIPLMGLWAYALMSCIVLAFKHTFKPELMSGTLYSACFAWGVHWVVARLLLRGLNVPGVPWAELLAYTGYPFVMISITIVAGFLAGKWGYYALGAYGSLCMAIFMVKTMKRVIFQETRTYGTDMRTANYLLLALAVFQFPFSFWLAYRPV